MSARQFPANIAQPLQELVTRLGRHYGERLRCVSLYGSMARRTQRADSDIDVLVVLDCINSLGDRLKAIGIASDINVELEVLIELQVLSQAELDFLRQTETLLARNLDRDGITLYRDGIA